MSSSACRSARRRSGSRTGSYFDFVADVLLIYVLFRRAKAKLVESKGRSGRPGSPGSGRDTPPDTPPELSPGYEADLQALLHESERAFSARLITRPH